MIGLPQADFIHAFHIGVSGKKDILINIDRERDVHQGFSSGETFGDVTCLSGVEKSELLKISIEKSPSTINGKEAFGTPVESHSNYQQPTLIIEQEKDLLVTESATVTPLSRERKMKIGFCLDGRTYIIITRRSSTSIH